MPIKRKRPAPPPAPKGNKRALGNRGGVGGPSKYNSTIPFRAFKLTLLGLTDKELALAFDVNESTINGWKTAHPEFAQALRLGKAPADADVAHSLYKRAKKGDVGAAKHWLNNRRPQNWRERIEHTGDPSQPVQFMVEFTKPRTNGDDA